MATSIVGGQTWWKGGRDEEGHRTYTLGIQTIGNQFDGPQQHLITPGLPLPGSVWAYDNDIDVWAWCTGAAKLTPRQGQGFVNLLYDHEYTFTTNPRGRRRGTNDDRGQRKKCADVTITDPLAEPPKRSGGSIKNVRERQYTRFNNKRARKTSFEPIIGQQAEFDESRQQVVIEFNDVNLNYATYVPLVDTVNINPLWGLPKRCWKLCEWHWEWKLYGTCLFYVTHRFVFESNCFTNPATFTPFTIGNDSESITYPAGQIISNWDHYIPDESTMAVRGNWSPWPFNNPPFWIVDRDNNGVLADYTNQNSYIPIRDPRGKGTVRRVLSRTTRGAPAVNEADELIWIWKEYAETDFLAQIPKLPSSF